MRQQPVLSDLVKEFPQLASSLAWSSNIDTDRQWSELAQLLWRLHAQGCDAPVQAAFHRLEQCLENGHPSRLWAIGFVQALQEIMNWECDDSDAFLRFLGARSRHVWSGLNALRFDLDDCSTLEAEVLMWRVVHHGLNETRRC